jgi:repressor LexA
MAASRTRENILSFIKRFHETKGYAPTVREIAENCGVKSPSVVQYHINHLERGGFITREKERFRSLRVAACESESVRVPLLGTIAAGHPIWVPSVDRWSAEAERTIELSPEITKGTHDVYALQVKGNSMVDAMIADSDIVIMERAIDVRSGDVVACWLRNEQEVTLKKIYFEGEKVRLQPCNPYMMPVYHDAGNVEVQGRVIAVIRVNR